MKILDRPMIPTVLFTVFAKIEQVYGLYVFTKDSILLNVSPKLELSTLFSIAGFIGFAVISWYVFKYAKRQYYKNKTAEYISSRFIYILTTEIFPENSLQGSFGDWKAVGTKERLKQIRKKLKEDVSNNKSLGQVRFDDLDDVLDNHFKHYEHSTDK